MRTTISIDDEVLARAHERAKARGITLGQLLEESLRSSLMAVREEPQGVPIPVFEGGTGLAPGIEPTTRGLLAALDEDQPADRLR